MKKLLKLLCVFLLTISIAACSKDKYADSQYLGTWVSEKANYNGQSVDVKKIVGEFTLTFNADETCTVKQGSNTADGKWEETDTGVTIDGNITGTKNSDGTLSITQSGVEFIFTKQ